MDLTQYDIKPEAMVNYLRYNGPHFSKKLCKFACSKMYKIRNGKKEYIEPYTKPDVDRLLADNKVELENNYLYDYIFVANMGKADFLGSSIKDESYLAKYIKDVIDDPDGYEGIAFNRWYADTCRKGEVVDWEEVL